MRHFFCGLLPVCFTILLIGWAGYPGGLQGYYPGCREYHGSGPGYVSPFRV